MSFTARSPRKGNTPFCWRWLSVSSGHGRQTPTLYSPHTTLALVRTGQRVADSTLRRTPSASVWPSLRQTPGPLSSKYYSTRRNHDVCGRTLGMVQPFGSGQERMRWAGSSAGVAPHAHKGVVFDRHWAHQKYVSPIFNFEYSEKATSGCCAVVLLVDYFITPEYSNYAWHLIIMSPRQPAPVKIFWEFLWIPWSNDLFCSILLSLRWYQPDNITSTMSVPSIDIACWLV